ncbi:MAG: hypothetical protein R3264_16940 [Anaerolineae bacterium]|nr:hypothetical protein [Anaerolineae bacterium]
MKCHKCENQAMGVCRFCGRAVCDDCYNEMPFILTVYVGEHETPKAVVVADSLWCGTCRPQPEPIPMPEIY